MITFYLNGAIHRISDINPNTTVLYHLRNHLELFDTKEGCASGDCGACTVMVKDAAMDSGFYTINACITLLSLMHGKWLFTASYLADNPTNNPEQVHLHPAQQALVDCHGSQCGFCTPGFVMSLACLYENSRLQMNETVTDEDASVADMEGKGVVNEDFINESLVIESISGNLCRCTGYRPIIEAGKKMFEIEKPSSIVDKLSIDIMVKDDKDVNDTTNNNDTKKNSDSLLPMLVDDEHQLFIPTSLSNLEQILINYPDAILWAGGTDLGLNITQQFIDYETIVQLSAIAALKEWALTDDTLIVGAGMTYQQLEPVLQQHLPQFAKIIHRIASPQIRNVGTIGGNIANASPIGDMPPILLALDAKVHIRRRKTTVDNVGQHLTNANFEDETIPLKDFFVDYKQTKLQLGSYIVAIHIPLLASNQQLMIYKISKRYEDDISACLLALRIDVDKTLDRITQARIGLGGMAAVPLLADTSQRQLKDAPLHIDSFRQAANTLPQDVTPLSDVRASREYRMMVIKRLLVQSGQQLINKYS